MGNGNLRGARAVLIALALIYGICAADAASAQAAGDCWFDQDLGRLMCRDEGAGGAPEPITDYWTSWRVIGPCGGGGSIGGVLVDITTGSVVAYREHVVGGSVVDAQTTCVDLDGAADEIWDQVALAATGLPDPGWEANPDGVISDGLTGLETWLWYSNPPQVGPIDASWTDPVTGLVFGVRGRGWTETIGWHTGDGQYDVFAPGWEAAPGVGGSPSTPAATHLYEVTSTDAGYPGGYPVSVVLHWVGEYQISLLAGVWTDWARFGSTLTEVFPDTYTVVEVRSSLSG